MTQETSSVVVVESVETVDRERVRAMPHRVANGALKRFRNHRDRNAKSLPKGYDKDVISVWFRALTFLGRKPPKIAVSAGFYTNIEAGDL